MIIITTKKYKAYFFIFFLCSSIAFGAFMLSSMDWNSMKISSIQVSLSNEENPLKIMDNQISYKGKVLTSTPEKKYYPSLSPDGQKIAYMTMEDIWGSIKIIDVGTGKIVPASLYNVSSGSTYGLEWLGNTRIAYYGHMNPSLDIYAIYNASNGELIDKYYGFGFGWDESKSHIFYVQSQPHFSNITGKDKVMMDNEAIYASDSNTDILGSLSVSPKGDKLAFFEETTNSGKRILVYIDRQTKNKPQTVKKVTWDYPIGEIAINDDDTITVTDNGKIIKYDIAKGKVF